MADAAHTRRIIVAISGASGAVYGARLLQVLQGQSGIETHLVASDAGGRNPPHEVEKALPPPVVPAPTRPRAGNTRGTGGTRPAPAWRPGPTACTRWPSWARPPPPPGAEGGASQRR